MAYQSIHVSYKKSATNSTAIVMLVLRPTSLRVQYKSMNYRLIKTECILYTIFSRFLFRGYSLTNLQTPISEKSKRKKYEFKNLEQKKTGNASFLIVWVRTTLLNTFVCSKTSFTMSTYLRPLSSSSGSGSVKSVQGRFLKMGHEPYGKGGAMKHLVGYDSHGHQSS